MAAVVAALAIASVIAVLFYHFLFRKNRDSAHRIKTHHYAVPEMTGDGWETASLDSENMDANLVCELFNRINDHAYQNIHSVLLVRDGKLVAEEYFPGLDSNGKYRVFTRDTLHTQQSVTKSVNSLLIGVAIDEHLIRSVDEKISTFFPEFAGENKDKVCLSHFLSMTSGLAWDQETYPYSDPRNDGYRINHSNDPVGFLLGKPVVEMPGVKFVYSNGIAIVLGEIIHKVSGLRPDKFAAVHLFAPLGITAYDWKGTFADGTIHTGGGLYLRPRDMAKIGWLIANEGRWQEKQIVSEGWIRSSIKQQAPDRPYGYEWWLCPFKVRNQTIMSCRADGFGGQQIFVFPSLHLVAVFTGWSPGREEQFVDILRQYILPATNPSPSSEKTPHSEGNKPL